MSKSMQYWDHPVYQWKLADLAEYYPDMEPDGELNPEDLAGLVKIGVRFPAIEESFING